MQNVQPLLAHDAARMGDYELLGRLGEGGQGVVYLGRSASGELVAVKMLHARFSGDPAARDRFLKEVAAARRVAEFSTARVLDASTDGDRPYIVSEYVEGVSLDQLVRESGPRLSGALERLGVGTMAALAAIHRAGVVHRDFKPSNVLLGLDGARVIDFGIAKALDATTASASGLIGTPAYMSPEQIAGETVGPPSDLFAWAVTMVFAATGRPAFGGDSVPAIFHRILTKEPDLPELSEPLGSLVEACLAKDPSARPTAAEALLRLVGHAPVPQGPVAQAASAVQAAGAVLDGPPETGAQLPGHEPHAVAADLDPDAERPAGESAEQDLAPTDPAIPPAAPSKPTAIMPVERSTRPSRPVTSVGPPVASLTRTPRARRPSRLRPALLLVGAMALAASVTAAVIVPQLSARSSGEPQNSGPGPVHIADNEPDPTTESTKAKPRSGVSLPSLEGWHIDEAVDRLQSLGLAAKVKRRPDELIEAGEVISTSPGPGRLAKGSVVTLYVSSGPEEQPAPDPSDSATAEPDDPSAEPTDPAPPTPTPTETPTDETTSPEPEPDPEPTELKGG
ncbi:protein kinase domain-containing protein [Nonomuraea dietziae]|uniref:protein kinase domain-containing protein n=1 Tax=Nonomuraea dietziae TaxID=65515 RepID=UPI0033F57383